MLLIEGPDGIGKTILAKKIVRKLSAQGVPVVYSWMTRPNEDKFDFFYSYRNLINPYAVQDRFHLSGMAYHDDKISPGEIEIVNRWIRNKGGMIVVIYAVDQQWYYDRIYGTSEHNEVTTTLMCQANNRYRDYARASDCDFSFGVEVAKEINWTPNFPADSDMFVDTLIDEWMSRRKAFGII